MLAFPLSFADRAFFEEEVEGETGVLVTLYVFLVTGDLLLEGVNVGEKERRTREENAGEDMPGANPTGSLMGI